jgi:hypothetical protein
LRKPPHIPAPERIWLLAALLAAGIAFLPRPVRRGLDAWLIASAIATVPLAFALAPLVPGGDFAMNVFLFAAAATVVFTRLRRLIYAAKEDLGVARGATLPKLEFPRYADASGVDIPPPPKKPAPPRPRKPRSS